MKKLLFIIAVALIGNHFFNSNNKNFSLLPILPAVAGEQVEKFEISDLYDSQTTLKSLAQPGAYTVVEIYSNHCGKCKKIEAKFPNFLKQRKDVVIKRVRTFSGSISFSSQQEQEQWMERQDSMLSFYKLRGTPHIEIYDANGGVIAKDKGGNKSGLKFLEQWLQMGA